MRISEHRPTAPIPSASTEDLDTRGPSFSEPGGNVRLLWKLQTNENTRDPRAGRPSHPEPSAVYAVAVAVAAEVFLRLALEIRGWLIDTSAILIMEGG